MSAHHHDQEPQTERGGHIALSHGAAAADADLAECPVMGSPVLKSQAEEAGFYRDYRGRRYWFCCAGCGPVFDADPEEYAESA